VVKNFFVVHSGKHALVYKLTQQGNWALVGKFKDLLMLFVHPIAGFDLDFVDLDRDEKLDAVVLWSLTKRVTILWGDGRGQEDLSVSVSRFQVADLNGDGWIEITVVTVPHRLLVWRFDLKQKKLRVIAKSPPLRLGSFGWLLYDIDGDSLNEIVVNDFDKEEWLTFKLQGERLTMRRSRTAKGKFHYFQVVKSGERHFLVTEKMSSILLFPPKIWVENRRLRWEWRTYAMRSIFWELPKGESALSPSNWHPHKAPFELIFADDIDGDGNDEFIGTNEREHFRLYRLVRTKSGKISWQSALLGKNFLVPGRYFKTASIAACLWLGMMVRLSC